MKRMEEITRILAAHKEELRENYKVKELGIFGSFVRGEQEEASDLDILVEFEEGAHIGLLKFIHLEHYLSGLLGVKVDLVMKSALKQRIGKWVLREVAYL